MAVLRPAVAIAATFTTSPLLSTASIFKRTPFKSNVVVQPGLYPSGVIRPDATASQSAYSLLPLAATSPELPLLDVDFCGECLPLDQTDVIDRWKHVFTLFRPHVSDLGNLRQRAEAFFPVIDPILAKYGIPDDFRYVPLAESALRPKAISRAGAAGYWQLMPGTARALGLKVGGRTDERFNVLKSTEAACRYIRTLYNQLGSWSLVAAAYNAGPGYIKNQLKRQAQRDYYSMSLPRETRYYLYRVLLYKEVMSRPADYSSFLTPVPTERTAFFRLWATRSIV